MSYPVAVPVAEHRKPAPLPESGRRPNGIISDGGRHDECARVRSAHGEVLVGVGHPPVRVRGVDQLGELLFRLEGEPAVLDRGKGRRVEECGAPGDVV